MASTVPRRINRLADAVILYEDTQLYDPDPGLLDVRSWPGAPAAPGQGGRGATLFIGHEGRQWVLRHYYRGGAIGRLVHDRYLWLGERHTRCFREWDLLAHLVALGLPVPRPVAAAYRRRGLTYTADLLTERIPGVEPLSGRLARTAMDAAAWGRVGGCIAAFHRAGVWHADLNAHNVQISATDEVFLLDFDRGRLRPPEDRWQQGNLARLHRSLTKISRSGAAAFGSREWNGLLAGYRAAMRRDRDGGQAVP
ncbi:MAG: 3-deoxy-D-manno-octulosonic acid kinase [Gammaproteobacteria bacterium]|nr:3-deoxy-D-manno-octulosonic acid kinase [Gammaproteobacteria bacterium]